MSAPRNELDRPQGEAELMEAVRRARLEVAERDLEHLRGRCFVNLAVAVEPL